MGMVYRLICGGVFDYFYHCTVNYTGNGRLDVRLVALSFIKNRRSNTIRAAVFYEGLQILINVANIYYLSTAMCTCAVSSNKLIYQLQTLKRTHVYPIISDNVGRHLEF